MYRHRGFNQFKVGGLTNRRNHLERRIKRPKMNTILIIDSNPIFRCILREIIQHKFSQLKIAEAGNVREGLRKSISDHPRLIITDLRLKGGPGLDMIGRIAARKSGTRIVVLTDMDEEEYRKAALAKGADDFISKDNHGGQKVMAIIAKQLFRA